jgi:hypothetical protein
MIEFIERFIKEGVHAPSGDNSQPWKFEISENRLLIYNLPSADNPVLNYKQTGSYIAHGGLIENICIAAEYYGYLSKVELGIDSKIENLVATIIFEKNNRSGHPLFKYIRERHTNRKIYYDKPLNVEVKSELQRIGGKIEGLKLFLVDEKESLVKLAKAASLMERVALENRNLHQLFFRDIFWSEEANTKGKSGLYIKTLELPKPVQFLFKLLRNWNFTRIINNIGFSKLAPKANANIYASGGAIGIIVMDNYDPKKFIDVGRLMQSIWLTSTKDGLYIQPITGLLFLAHKIFFGDSSIFTSKHIADVKIQYQHIVDTIGLKSGLAVFMFRIGYADKATSFAERREPIITVLK